MNILNIAFILGHCFEMIKRIITTRIKPVALVIALIGALNVLNAQTNLFRSTFEPGPSGWTLNTRDTINGIQSTTGGDNFWIRNNRYSGNGLVPNTDPQPAGIVNSPNSTYLHILALNFQTANAHNANYVFNNPSRERYFAKMNGSISTVGFKDVEFSFWWLNWAAQDTSGQVFYSIDNGSTWIRTPNTYAGDSTWKKETIKLPIFENQAQLTFGFLFINPDKGTSPGFAIDDVNITGKPKGAPTADFTVDKQLVCEGKCVKFTDLSKDNPTKWHWNFGTGNPADTSDQQNPTFCFPNKGKYSITLIASNAAGSSAPMIKTNYIEVVDCNAAPQANFSMNGLMANTITICSGDSIMFADSSKGQVSSRYWSFPGARNDSGECRIVNDTIPVTQMVYPCAGSQGRDTTYTATLNVSGAAGATFKTKTIVVQSCIGAKARVKDWNKQRKMCENQCIELEYDETVEDEYFIKEKPTFLWYVWGIDTTRWDSASYNPNDPNIPVGDTNKVDTMFTDKSVTVCYPDSGAFRVALVTENKYGKDSVWYDNLISVYGYPEVYAIASKQVVRSGFSTELNTDSNTRIPDVPSCKELSEFEKFNGDTAICHNYFWSYKPFTGGDHQYEGIENRFSNITKARPTELSWYHIIKENYNGCRSVDSVLILIDSTYEVGIPDVFSPGANGTKNSRWYVFGNKITKIDVKVFNRYGQVVYKTDKIEEIVWESDIPPVDRGWNGNFNNEQGRELDPGVYTYVVKVYHENGRFLDLSGDVTLMR